MRFGIYNNLDDGDEIKALVLGDDRARMFRIVDVAGSDGIVVDIRGRGDKQDFRAVRWSSEAGHFEEV